MPRYRRESPVIQAAKSRSGYHHCNSSLPPVAVLCTPKPGHPTLMELKFECPACGQHLSATPAQIGVTAPCPKCNAGVVVPKTSTLPVSSAPPPIRFACASCGQHISALRAQIGITFPCPNCSVEVTIPKTSTLPPKPAALREIKVPKTKRYETTVILIDHCAPTPARTKKLKKWTDDLTDARNWLIHQLAAPRGDQYFAGIFDHKEKKSVFKEKARIES